MAALLRRLRAAAPEGGGERVPRAGGGAPGNCARAPGGGAHGRGARGPAINFCLAPEALKPWVRYNGIPFWGRCTTYFSLF